MDIDEYPEGQKYVYYIHYYSTLTPNMTWSGTKGRSIIYYPHENPLTVYFDKETKGADKYFVVGCFDGSDISNFIKVGKVTCSKPTSADVCYNQEPCPTSSTEPNELEGSE